MAADQPAAVVAGGGIAGLASAIALAQAGWTVTVLERAPAFGEVGAGLAITANGRAALAALGLDEAVRAAGYQTTAAGFQDSRGRWLVRIPDSRSDLRSVVTLWGLHRQRLHAVLLRAAQAADGVDLRTAAEVTGVRPGRPGAEQAEVTWRTDGGQERLEAALVVGADGVRSTVRGQVFPGVRPRYGGSTSWRAVIEDSSSDRPFIAAWGPGTEFGALRVSGSEVYWYGYFRHPEGAVIAGELAAAREHFAGWAPWIRDIVAATPADRLMRHDVYHLPQGPPAYTSGRVVLVGDAAHACLPTAGQGAATALEDGVCIGRMIAEPALAGADFAACMGAFDRARRPRCRRIISTAIMIGRLGADVGGGWRQAARNSLLRLVPAGPFAKAGQSIVDWTAPQPGTLSR